jgi:hypothetical protein
MKLVTAALLALVTAVTHTLALLVDAGCSASGDCSEKWQAALSSCTADCNIRLTPPGALFALEQSAALIASDVHGLSIDGQGARLVLDDGSASFLNLANCSKVTISNLTLSAVRPPFTFGVVQEEDKGGRNSSSSSGGAMVVLRVDASRYPMGTAMATRFPWLLRVVAMHEVDAAAGFQPLSNGLDWIIPDGQPDEALNLTVSSIIKISSGGGGASAHNASTDAPALTVSFPDQGFGLKPGVGVVFRHLLEFSHPKLDSIVLQVSQRL